MEENKPSTKIVISGEDCESDDEFDRSTALKSIANNSNNSNNSKSLVSGEADESDVDDFGSTISLDSSSSIGGGGGAVGQNSNNTFPRQDSQQKFGLTSIITAAQKYVDNSSVRRHRERNKSLRYNISEKLLKPTITQNIKKLDKFSQNLSNSQMQMQEALFCSRLATSNLLKLQKEFENLLQEDYLNELKIPSKSEPTSATSA